MREGLLTFFCYERLKSPIAFTLIVLSTVFTLLMLLAVRTELTKKQSSPLLIVENKSAEPANEIGFIQTLREIVGNNNNSVAYERIGQNDLANFILTGEKSTTTVNQPAANANSPNQNVNSANGNSNQNSNSTDGNSNQSLANSDKANSSNSSEISNVSAAKSDGKTPDSSKSGASSDSKSLEEEISQTIKKALKNIGKSFKTEADLFAAINESADALYKKEVEKPQNALDADEKTREQLDERKKIISTEIDNKLNPESNGDAPTEISRAEFDKLIAAYQPKTEEKKKDDKKKKPEDDDEEEKSEPKDTFQSNIYSALNSVKKDDKTEIFNVENIKKVIKDRLEADKPTKNITDKEDEISKIKTKYQAVTGRIYRAEEKRLKTPPDYFLNLFFSDDGGLYVVYQLVMVTLMAIIVFSLLFLILPPIRNIFFLDSPTADVIIDKAKGLINVPSARVLFPGVAGTLLATAATVGVGVAAIVGSPAPGVSKKITNIFNDNTKNSRQNNYNGTLNIGGEKDDGEGGGEGKSQQLIINALSKNIADLNLQVATLTTKIENHKSGDPNDVKIIETAVKNLTDQVNILNKNYQQPYALPPASPAPRDYSSQLDGIRNEMAGINIRIGQPRTAPFDSLFNGLGEVNKNIGDVKTFLGDFAVSDPPKTTAASRLNDIFRQNNRIANAINVDEYLRTKKSIYEDFRAAETTSRQIEQNTSEIGRNIFGAPSNSLSRKLGNIFSLRQRYVMTAFVVQDLKNNNETELKNATKTYGNATDNGNVQALRKARIKYDELKLLIDALEKVLPDIRLSALTEDELFNAMKDKTSGIDSAWKKWKGTILRSTRVSSFQRTQN